MCFFFFQLIPLSFSLSIHSSLLIHSDISLYLNPFRSLSSLIHWSLSIHVSLSILCLLSPNPLIFSLSLSPPPSNSIHSDLFPKSIYLSLSQFIKVFPFFLSINPLPPLSLYIYVCINLLMSLFPNLVICLFIVLSFSLVMSLSFPLYSCLSLSVSLN